MEIFWNSEWRTICSDGWDDLDAHVVCRQLHYLSTSVEVQGIHRLASYLKNISP